MWERHCQRKITHSPARFAPTHALIYAAASRVRATVTVFPVTSWPAASAKVVTFTLKRRRTAASAAALVECFARCSPRLSIGVETECEKVVISRL